MTVFLLLFLSLLSGVLYRMGGCGPADLQSEWGWVPKFIRNFPKKRDVGCGICMLIGCSIVGMAAPWWAWILAFGLLWASLSTYWDQLFGYDNHWFHGFVIGMSILPVNFGWLTLGIAAGLGILMGVWSKALGNATWEELGRGFFMPIALALVLI